MTIEQDFLPYAVGSNANVLTQSQYSALTTLLQSGMSAGIVPSNQLNKILRQPSIIASVIAQLIVANSGQPAIDDGTTATLLANLQTAITVIARQNPVLADTGIANAYAAANAAAFTAYPSVSGLVIDVAIANANTGASTLAIDGLAAKPIYGLALLPLQGGELPKGIASFIYIVASTVNGGNGAWVLMEAPGGAQQVGVATASQHAATLGQVQSGLSAYAIDAGTANTYVVTLSPAIGAYTDGVKIRFRALTANAGASTLNVNGLGAVALVGGAHAALAGGEIIPGGYCEAEYNGALSKFVLLECTGAPLQVANATASQHAVPLGQIQAAIQENLYSASSAGGTSDALTASFTPAITATAMASGVVGVTVRAASANSTTTPTFTPNSGVISAATIVKGNGLPLAAGDIAGAGHWITLQWDSTLAKWVLLNPATGVSINGNPTGTVIESAAVVAPAGYLACPTAQTNLSRITYANLFNALSIQTTATWTSGSTSLAVASAANMFVGYPISGTGIPSGATITAISGTTLTISAATTAAGAAAAIVVAPWGVGDGSTTFGMPWFSVGYAGVQSGSGIILGSQTVGQVISHSHTVNGAFGNYGAAGSGSQVLAQIGSQSTNSTGGSANLAAGVGMNRFVKY